MRKIRAQIREHEFTPTVAVAQEELRLRGRSLDANTDDSEAAGSGRSREENDVARIPAASSAQELWAQHKYSVLARDPEAYEEIGRRLAREEALDRASLRTLVDELETFLRQPPEQGRLINAVQHLWGYVNEESSPEEHPDSAAGREGSLDDPVRPPDWDHPLSTVRRIGHLAREQDRTYLLHSTALSDLSGWLAFLSDRE